MSRTMLVILAVAAVGSFNCQKVAIPQSNGQPVIKAVRALTDDEKLDLLRSDAKKRGLHWRIFCTSDYMDEKESYLAVAAWTERSLHATYEDDGLTDEWMESRDTPADAALALYQAIQGAPTHPVSKWGKRSTDHERTHRQCKPEITSEGPSHD